MDNVTTAPAAAEPIVTPAAMAPVTPVAAEPAKAAPDSPVKLKSEVVVPKPSILSDAGKTPTPVTDATKTGAEAGKEGEAKPAEAPKEGEPAKATVPEKYEIKAPDGITLDEAVLAEFTPIAKELGLTNEQVQKLADFQANQIKNAQSFQKQEFDKFVDATRKETTDYFGSKLSAELPYIAKGRDNFANEGVLSKLESCGLASDKDFMLMFSKMGRSVSEQKLVDGKVDSPTDTRTDGQVIYAKPK